MTETSLTSFFENWELFRASALAGTLAGALLGWLGVYVVLRRMIFLSAALSQTAGLGVAASFYARIHWGVSGLAAEPTLGAAAATLATTFLLAGGRGRQRGVRRDATLGLAWLLGAAGTLAIGTRIVQEVQDIQSILFGSAVAVLDEDFDRVVTLSAVLAALHLWWRRGFLAAAFDAEGARVRGLPVWLLDFVLLCTLALAISLCTRVLGALPVFAFSVLPALAAISVVRTVNGALALAAALGAVAGFGGYLLAYRLELPVGGAQTLLAIALVAVTTLVGRGRARLFPDLPPSAVTP
jgi:zinc transport system permease protein